MFAYRLPFNVRLTPLTHRNNVCALALAANHRCEHPHYLNTLASDRHKFARAHTRTRIRVHKTLCVCVRVYVHAVNFGLERLRMFEKCWRTHGGDDNCSVMYANVCLSGE